MVIREKGESQNGCFKKTKYAKFSEKQKFFTPWYTHIHAYQGVRNVHFTENLVCFVFLKHPFWDSPFCLITDKLEEIHLTYITEIVSYKNFSIKPLVLISSRSDFDNDFIGYLFINTMVILLPFLQYETFLLQWKQLLLINRNITHVILSS